MNTQQLHWLAGIVEGEGCFTSGGSNGQPRLTVGMTDEDIIRRCHAITSLGTVYGPRLFPSHPDWKPKWEWVVTKQVDVASLMMTLFPLLGIRRSARVRELLVLWQSLPGRAVGPRHPIHSRVVVRQNGRFAKADI